MIVETEQPERFTVAIHAQVVTDESAAHSDVDRYETDEDHETTYTLAELVRYLQREGITECEGSDWFYSVDPVGDRAFFELGEHKTYSAHVHRNGAELSAANFGRIAKAVAR